MKHKQRLCLLLSSFALIIVCGIYVQPVQAQEGVGGAVQTNGEIGFYKDDDPVTSSSSTAPSSSSSSTPPKSSSSTVTSGTVTKPTGNYPSTGELIKKSLSLSGIALVLLAFLLFLFKRKKKEVGE